MRKGIIPTVGAVLVGGDDPQSFGSSAWWRPSATPYRPLSDRLDECVTNGRVPFAQKGTIN